MRSILIATGIFAPDIGGPASYARALGARLSADGIQVTVLTYSSTLRHAGDADMPFSVRRVWRVIPWGLRHAIYAFRAYIAARSCDGVLLLNASSAGGVALWAARLARRRVIVRIAGDYAWEMAVQSGQTHLLIDDFQRAPKRGRVARLDRLQRRVCRSADAVLVPSKYLAGMVEGWGVPRDRITVIYNGADVPLVAAPKEEARRHIGISGSLIVSVGRLVPWKGFRMLIKLMPQLLQVNQFFRLVIVGDGPDMAMLQSVVRNLGLERKVFLVGRMAPSELAWYLAAADVFVLNTGYEGFSHQILEAMQAGVPVITTTAGGNPEVVVQGENGFLVRYNDEFNIAEAIKTVSRQPELRERLIEQGRVTAQAFSLEHMYRETKKF
ncbi:MAG: glycosyltransferase family 4 protein, partial [Candidatus Yanofskybacteria bacterium]|nr:glycosyltransferase family 4 protein [Candidatus Yanofskybacteria bacterium]